jgi:uncharacterized membrane protein
VLGAGGGYLIGAAMNKNDREHKDEAIKASDRDRENPPTTDDVRRSRTADLNNDGYVTLNEVVAMRKADLSDDEMINRLQDTGQVFSLSSEQENYLRDRGVSDTVIRAMRTMNQDRARTASDRYDANDRYDSTERGTDRIDSTPEGYNRR